jgi:hypothetical protein
MHKARSSKFTAPGLALLLSTLLVACGGGGTTAPLNSSGSTTSAATTAVQINMGDSPADWMLAFSMNISSMSLAGSNGSVTVIPSTTPVEMMHLMGVMQPLSMPAIPQETYTGASITVASATVTYMDPSTKTPIQQTIAGPITTSVSFPSPVTVGTTPMAMSFELNLANSISTNSSGTLIMNPAFNFSYGMQGTGNPIDFSDGGIQQMMGMVSSVSGSSFSMTPMQAAQTFRFSTNASTSFTGTTMSGMASGMILLIDATLQPDGSLLATNVQSMMASGGVMGGGVITAVSGSPATQLTMIMQNGAGSGMMASYFAQGATITLASTTTYQIDQNDVDMSSLPFTPTFDATHVYAGQNVMPGSTTGMISGSGMGSGMMGGTQMSGSISATSLYLEQQGLSGTTASSITSGTTAQFTLTLPLDCAFTTLTGASSITVFQQPDTIISGNSTIASGASVHAFGLLFFDNNQWKMVASRIGTN